MKEPVRFKGSSNEKLNTRISRPEPPSINPSLDDLEFMQIDVDCDSYHENFIDIPKGKENTPLIRIYGITDSGSSVCVLVEDFYPYFYVKPSSNFIANKQNIEKLKNLLTAKLEAKNKENKGEMIVNIEIVKKTNIYYYTADKEDFIKLTLLHPKYVSPLREVFENKFAFDNVDFDTITFESKLNFPLRYMVDNGIVGISWITLPKGKFNIRSKESQVSTCQIEANISYRDLISHKPEGKYARIAPMRVLSFDIEAAAEKGHFPSADHDPIIQIANICIEFGNPDPIIQNLFSLKECAEIVGAKVFNFNEEVKMLNEWRDFIVDLDPDIIIGYNINNFDFPYLFERAAKIGAKNFGKMSRICKTVTKAKRVGGSSAKSFNNRELININMDGRAIIDMYLLIVKEHKLRSNTLNNVSQHFLGEQKEDVHHSMIYDLWKTDNYTRRRLGLYCLKDALLPWKLCQKLMTIYNFAEMCRVTCTPLNFILSRGQQIKVAAQLYREALKQEYLIPSLKIAVPDNDDEEEGYEGAYVLDPKPNFYQVPIVTLDFASLYPSIMIAHNLCYTTLVKKSEEKNFSKDDIFISPTGDCFVKEHIRKGILPIILVDLISARKKAKAELKEAKDEDMKGVLDGRQLALKISANSVYGFTGAQVGQLPCLNISASVTSVGRSMIENTRDLVLKYFNKINGYENDSDVIYGDTDSVMIKFGVADLARAMELGGEASKIISEKFKKPIKLEFEKVYMPYLLMKKKRYAGLIWTKLEKWDKIDTKGLEVVRRDNCNLIKDLLDKVLKLLMLNKDGVKLAIEESKSVISDLLKNKIDISKLIISKTISKKSNEDQTSSAKNVYQGKQGHVVLADKIRKRDEGTAPSIGDRVPYVMIKGAKNSKNYDNCEDPRYVQENNLPIDYDYYIEHQLKKPLVRLFEYVLNGQEEAEKVLFSKSI